MGRRQLGGYPFNDAVRSSMASQLSRPLDQQPLFRAVLVALEQDDAFAGLVELERLPSKRADVAANLLVLLTLAELGVAHLAQETGLSHDDALSAVWPCPELRA